MNPLDIDSPTPEAGTAITALCEASTAFCDMPAKGAWEAIIALQAAREMVCSCSLMEQSTRISVIEALDNEIGRCDMDHQESLRERADARDLQRDRRADVYQYHSEPLELDAFYRNQGA